MKCGASSTPEYHRNLRWGSQIISKGGERTFKPKLQPSWLGSLGGQDTQYPHGGKPRSPYGAVELLHLRCVCQAVQTMEIFFPSLSKCQGAKQEGVWDYPSSECSRWSNSHGSCCCPDGRGQREHGRRGPSEGSCSRPIYHGGFQRFVPVTFCWAQAEGCRGFGDCLFLS